MESIAGLLKTAGASDDEVEKLMVGSAWHGSLELLLELAADAVERRFSELQIGGATSCTRSRESV